jgi:hypothetical protein
MSTVVLGKVSTPVTKTNFSSEIIQIVSSSISVLTSIYHGAKSMRNTEWFFKILFNFVLIDQ